MKRSIMKSCLIFVILNNNKATRYANLAVLVFMFILLCSMTNYENALHTGCECFMTLPIFFGSRSWLLEEIK
jgi:hypothetical protein